MNIEEIEFSQKTYQIQIEGFWAFLQLNDKGTIRDAFCSCEQKQECLHIKAAFKRIYHGHKQPLHIRFEKSLWNALATCFFAEGIKRKQEGLYVSASMELKSVHPHIQEILDNRIEETEETSLKFSNLSDEELALWRDGKPNEWLKKELSPWSDLAKWWMVMQDENLSYSITFSGDIPLTLEVTFPEMTLSFTLTEKQLATLIPTLKNVNCPLRVYDLEETSIQKITYDTDKEALVLVHKEEESPEVDGVGIDGWIYVAGDGFYAKKKHHLLAKPQLRGREIERAFNEHLPLMKQHLKGHALHDESTNVQYALAFDETWNLHIEAYIFNPHDLCHSFGEWAYLDGKGFYHLAELYFPELDTVILSAEVSRFVHTHKIWLNAQEGFHTFVGTVESRITYKVDRKGDLLFSYHVDQSRSHEFGSWVYVEGKGFYSKKKSPLQLPEEAFHPIPKKRVSAFIEKNRSELQYVSGFFAEDITVNEGHVQARLTADGGANVIPYYGVEADETYGIFLYLAKKGFVLIPHERLLPEAYREPIAIDPEKMAHFILQDLPLMKGKIDSSLIFAEEVSCVIDHLELEDGFYVLKGHYEVNGVSAGLTDIWYEVFQKKRFHFTENGFLDLSKNRYSWLHRLDKSQVDRRSKTLKFSTLELIRFSLQEKLSHPLVERIFSFSCDEELDISKMKGTLRPYQQIGLQWLWFLYTHNLSGLLCDDMGLGKTHQTMALLAAVQRTNPKAKFLVVCPTSVLYHWEDKLKGYLPGASICLYHGSDRKLMDTNVLLTSYGIWRKSHHELKKIYFDVAIYDEIQLAKNVTSRTHATLRQVQAKMRLGLTGTPIENVLYELKNLFDLVLPGYMPKEKEYIESFVKPIEEGGDVEARGQLTTLIRPFLLRRKKETVLNDLPEKVEEIAHCTLSEDQKILYQEVLDQGRLLVLPEIEDRSESIPYIHIFSLLSSLKQVCNHPAAYYKRPKEFREYSSGKWNLFVELLREARGSSQKVVVFSQYLAMLDIIEEFLKEENIGFASLRGSTQDRAAEIRKFNDDPNCEVFVGSLGASGLGIDLTAGSVVIHYDRWWNAAKENQATDRVHRIGQTRGVQVFKLVTKDSFEEKIDAMIARKGRLMEEVVASDDHRIIKRFTRDELIHLLKFD